MVILKIKRAETALAEGRLEEAMSVLCREDVRSHRRGQELLSELARAFVHRGHDHLAEGRIELALADARRASEVAGDQLDVAQLRAAAGEVMLAGQRNQRHAERIVAAVQQQVNLGNLSVAKHLLAAINLDESRVRTLMQDVNTRQLAADSGLRHAQAAIDRQDWETALDELARVRSANPSEPKVAELTLQVEREVVRTATAAFELGRLDQAARLVDRVTTLATPRTPQTADLSAAIAECRAAAAVLSQGRPGDAIEAMLRAQTLQKSALWIGPVIEQLRAAATALQQVRAGPLGMIPAALMPNPPAAVAVPPLPAAPGRPPTLPGVRPASAIAFSSPGMPRADTLPSRFCLQVDGVGSFIVCTGSNTTLGPVSSSRTPDVALVAEASAAVASIERLDEDYFIRSASPVGVNDAATTGKLLASGDRLELSPRCKLTFSLPHPASTSAVLDLTGARFPRADVRRVILLDRDLVIGPGPSCHVRIDGLLEPCVLKLRQGKLFWAAAAGLTANDQPLAADAPLPLGTHLKCDSLSFVLTRV